MLKWCRIRKRTGNATLYGNDLGAESAKVKVTVLTDEDLKLPRPSIPKTLIRKSRQESRP